MMVMYVLPLGVTLELREFASGAGFNPFAVWFKGLNAEARMRVSIALDRLRHGNFSNVKTVGTGVLEYRIQFGPGYRVYFGKENDRIILLLAGGKKARQSKDIAAAQERWAEYRERRKQA